MKILLIAALLLGLGDSLAKADIDWRTKGAVNLVQNQGATFSLASVLAILGFALLLRKTPWLR